MRFLDLYEGFMEKRREYILQRYKDAMVSMNEEEVISYINKHCSEWVNKPHMVHRGLDKRGNGLENYDYFYSKPIERTSKDNANFYTLLMDRWEGYPKRSKSFCCSSNYKIYGDYDFLVIPEDGSRWGIAPKSDIWDSFRVEDWIDDTTNNWDISYFFNTITNIAYNLDIKIKDNNYEDFKQGVIELETTISGMSTVAYNVFVDEYFGYNDVGLPIIKILRDGDNLFGIIEKIISPDRFKVLDWEDMVNYVKDRDNPEIWTDSGCVFIANTTKNRKLLMENFNLKNIKCQ